MKDEMVTIKKKEHDRLRQREAFLEALEAAGVDNWVGFDDAQEILAGGE